MKKFVLLLTIFCQAACASTSDQRVVSKELKEVGLKAELRSISEISRKESGTLKLEFFESSEKKRTPVVLEKTPEVSLWMEMSNGNGHGSEKLEIKLKGSAYIITNAWFLMMGDWELKVKATHKGKTVLSSFPLCVERKPSESHVGECKVK